MPIVAAILVAILGSVGGFATLMKVNADNSKTISEGATNVVEMLQAQTERQQHQINAALARLDALEGYASRFDDWADKISSLLNRAINQMPDPPRESFRQEATDVHLARPKRRVADAIRDMSVKRGAKP
jgi:DNA repair ATPase RecN